MKFLKIGNELINLNKVVSIEMSKNGEIIDFSGEGYHITQISNANEDFEKIKNMFFDEFNYKEVSLGYNTDDVIHII